jgi:integrase
MAKIIKDKTGFRQDEEYRRFELLLKKRGAVDALPAFLKVFKRTGRISLDFRGKDYNELGIPGRVFPASEQEAVDKFVEVWRAKGEHGRETKSLAFDSVRLGGFVRAKKLLADSGCDDSVEDCIRDFVAAKRKMAEAGFAKSLADFVEYSLSLVMPKGSPVTFEELQSLWLEARREKLRKGRIEEPSLKENMHRLARFIRLNAQSQVRSFDRKQGELALEACYGAQSSSTYNGALGNLRQMLKWGIAEQLIEVNWASEISRRKESDKTYGGQVYDVDEVRKLLQFLRNYEGGAYLGAFVMTLFNGYRINASRRMAWSDFDLDREDPKVQAKREKNPSSKRIRPVLPNALEWLKLCPRKFNPDHSYDHWSKLCSNNPKFSLFRKAGVVFRSNGLRHTFGTYSTVYRGFDETKQLMGHEKMTDQLENHYLEYASRPAAEEFCTLVPYPPA